VSSPDRNDELRRRSDEGWAFKERRDEFFRCGGYDHLERVEKLAPSRAYLVTPDGVVIPVADVEIVQRPPDKTAL